MAAAAATAIQVTDSAGGRRGGEEGLSGRWWTAAWLRELSVCDDAKVSMRAAAIGHCTGVAVHTTSTQLPCRSGLVAAAAAAAGGVEFVWGVAESWQHSCVGESG